jgi:hypothetical protein
LPSVAKRRAARPKTSWAPLIPGYEARGSFRDGAERSIELSTLLVTTDSREVLVSKWEGRGSSARAPCAAGSEDEWDVELQKFIFGCLHRVVEG